MEDDIEGKREDGIVIIPKTLKIGGHQYKIIFPYQYVERWDRWGDCDDTQKVIRITDSDGGGQKRAESSTIVTFIHEILHAIDYLTGHKQFSGDEGEKRIEALSEGIYQVFKDNKLRFDE